jgi:hypothetical protein
MLEVEVSFQHLSYLRIVFGEVVDNNDGQFAAEEYPSEIDIAHFPIRNDTVAGSTRSCQALRGSNDLYNLV